VIIKTACKGQSLLPTILGKISMLHDHLVTLVSCASHLAEFREHNTLPALSSPTSLFFRVSEEEIQRLLSLNSCPICMSFSSLFDMVLRQVKSLVADSTPAPSLSLSSSSPFLRLLC